jgi:hypothetical protein
VNCGRLSASFESILLQTTDSATTAITYLQWQALAPASFTDLTIVAHCFAASFIEYLYISTERSVVGCFNELW